jgi:hypothetical protein
VPAAERAGRAHPFGARRRGGTLTRGERNARDGAAVAAAKGGTGAPALGSMSGFTANRRSVSRSRSAGLLLTLRA